MRKTSLCLALYLAFFAGAARAETAKAADDLNGCVERAKVEKYISSHNFAELLRGETSDGKTQAIWTSGSKVLIVSYVRPPEGKMDELKTICVVGSMSNVNFNFAVIERLVQSAAESLKSK